MAFDSYIVNRLCSWARWASRDDDGGIGYPKQCAFTNTMPYGGVEDYTLDINESCLEIDLCVKALSIEKPDLYAAIYAHYRRNDLTVSAKLMHIGCCKQTYYNKIDTAHNLIIGWLNDISCGVKIPSKEINFNKIKKIA